MENYACFVLETLLKETERTLLVVDDAVMTRAQFHSRVSSVAQFLKASSLKPGDRVLLTITPSLDMFCVAVAIFALGGTIILIDPSMGLERYNYCIGKSDPAMCVWIKGTKMKWLKYIFPSIKAIPKLIEISPTLSVPEKLLLPDDVINAEHALITFTTGSTCMPKLLLRKHEFLLFQSKCISNMYNKHLKDIIKLEEEESAGTTNLPVFPLHFLKIGGTSVLFPRFTTCDPAAVIASIKKHNVNFIGGSLHFVHRVAKYAADNGIMLPVQLAMVGGSTIYRGPLRTISSVVPDKNVLVVYGSTEVEPISVILAKEKQLLEVDNPPALCVGRPFVNDSVRVIPVQDESKVFSDQVDLESLASPCGEIGEILVSGWHVNTNEVEEKRLIHDTSGRTWLRIEDAGYIDNDGYIWLVGRAKWRVKDPISGKTFWSAIIEQKILERTSKITFAAYLNHKDKAYLFIEAPEGLPPKEKEALESFIKLEGVPVDELVIKPHIAKDRRHASKPNTSVLFADKNKKWIEGLTLVKFVVSNNPMILVVWLIIKLVAIFIAFYLTTA